MRHFLYSITRYSIMLFIAFYSADSVAINNVLDRIEVQESRDQSVVKVVFTERLVYRSHAPKNKADLIHVDVNVQNNAEATFEDEYLIWNPSDTIPLFEVGLQWADTTQADLTFKFNKQVDFELQPSADSYSITLTIHHPQAEQAVVTPLPSDELLPVPAFQKTAENEILANLMEEARQAMAKEEYSAAIALYTKVLGNDTSVFAKQALEYLGVAREKKKQLAHAKNIYDQYLKRYPKGEDADRVRQRLLAMISVSEQPKEKLRELAKVETKSEVASWEYYGGFSQYYNRSTTIPDEGNNTTTQNELRSDLDFTTRLRGQKYDLSARFTGGHSANFITDKDNSERISSMYFDAKDKVLGASVRLGRQSRTTGGVLGRFDGLFGDYQLTEKVKLNLVTGSPVDSSKDMRINSERFFYGVSADIGTINKAWDFNVFAINQTNDGLTDRRAIGGEARYFDPQKSFFSLVDYDIFYNSLNMMILNGRWSFSEKTTFNTSYEYRNSPLLTTRNAIIGQGVDALQDLRNIFSKSTIYTLAEDRTANSNMLFAGLTHQFTPQYQINGDVRLSKLSDTPASGGVLAADGTNLEKEYSLQFTGTSLLKEGDLAIFTASYSDLTSSNVTTFLLNTRYPITQELRINPKFKYRHRNNDIDGSTQDVYTPTLQVTYRLRRNFQLEGEISNEWETIDLAGVKTTNQNAYFLLGYRFDF